MSVNKAPESFVAKVQAAIIEHDPEEVETLDELAVQKTASYIYFGMDGEFPDDGPVYEIYYIIKFVNEGE